MRGLGIVKLLVAGAGLAALWAYAPSAAEARPPLQVVYVAQDLGWSSLEADAVQAGRAVGLETAPLGDISFVASTSSFTLSLDDKVPVGTMPVLVSLGDRGERVCMAPNVPVTFGGITPGTQIVLWLDGTGYVPWRGCSRGATTGIATISF